MKCYDELSQEEKDKYHNEWNEYKENHHDLQLEKSIDKANVSLDEPNMFENHKKDFKVSYKTNRNDLDQTFDRKRIKVLFDNGFKYIIISKTNSLYKRIQVECPRVLRSPETNICGYDRTKLTLFIKDNHMYAYTGGCWYKDNNEYSFDYVGRIVQPGEARQLNMFEMI